MVILHYEVTSMKKVVIIVVISMLCVGVQAKSQEPQFEIIASSNQEEDIKEMYQLKDRLIDDYKEWVKGVNNKDQVLADHVSDYHATYKQGVYKVVMGEGKGKSLKGDLKVNYCESTKDIKTKSFLFGWLFD